MSLLPAYDRLFAAKHVLLLGAGGGYDVLGAVPLFAELRERGIPADFASVSFTALETLPGTEQDAAHPCLYAVPGAAAVGDRYCPEAWLARWLEREYGQRSPVWGIAKVGVKPLRAALASLIERRGVDLLVLVDGGIDLTLRGDETSIGTPSEDLATLAAAAALPVAALAMCIGFGSELRDGIPHAQVLERFAALQRAGAFLGAQTLDAATPAGASYCGAHDFIQAGQAQQRGTHIHGVVRAAMAGEFGGTTPDVWVSPLAAIRWYFDVRGLAASHLALPYLEQSETIWDVSNLIRSCRKSMAVRTRTEIPL